MSHANRVWHRARRGPLNLCRSHRQLTKLLAAFVAVWMLAPASAAGAAATPSPATANELDSQEVMPVSRHPRSPLTAGSAVPAKTPPADSGPAGWDARDGAVPPMPSEGLLASSTLWDRRYYYTTTVKELLSCFDSAHVCLTAWRLAKYALAEAERRFPPESLYNGLGDAFRHCLWAATLSAVLGADTARHITTRHEEGSTSHAESMMDLYNNNAGLQAALWIPCSEDEDIMLDAASDSCFELACDGDLQTLNGDSCEDRIDSSPAYEIYYA